MQIRQARVEDAKSLAKAILDVESESEYMLYGAGERNWSTEIQEKMINAFNEKKRHNIFVAQKDNDILGYLIIQGGATEKNKHSASIVIGVKEEAQGQGVGTQLFEKMEEWARSVDLHRLELTVIVENIAACNLYKKMGFEVEGTKRDSLKLGERFVDEYYLAKLI
ncbi:GNAT family N-acetyltransferase [Piscibacillus sp. B03]|uniref:GNAT family N-acetyltransferase n=1 Tax=Piscibacillus sp. B03 TaxID=3457430 RepID=UPI003FCD437F